jgi:hypothetical protein
LNLLYIHMRGPNGVNGNPRRCYVVLNSDTGNAVDVLDEDYSGEAAVNRKYPGVVRGPAVNVRSGESAAWVGLGEDLRSGRLERGA